MQNVFEWFKILMENCTLGYSAVSIHIIVEVVYKLHSYIILYNMFICTVTMWLVLAFIFFIPFLSFDD